MKTIGLIGGMSWESTITYYRVINEVIKEKLGGLHSAKILLYSVDFDEIEQYQASGRWDKSAEVLADAGERLKRAGADVGVICTNTMHKVFDQVQAKVNMPFLHIADTTAEVLREHKITKVLLLGTKYTMTQDFYKERIKKADIEVVVPDENEIELINTVIYEELCLGKINQKSRQEYIKIIEKYAEQGAKGVILGCTEIGLLIQQKDISIPAFDTAYIHAKSAAYYTIS